MLSWLAIPEQGMKVQLWSQG